MNKRTIAYLLVALVLFALVPGLASSQASGPPVQDTFWNTATAANNNGTDLRVRASILPSPCTDNDVIYLRWDLSGIPVGSTVSSATLTLTTSPVVSGAGTSTTLELLQVTDDTWNETDNSTGPGYGTSIETKTVAFTSSTAGQTVVFNSAALASWVQANRVGAGGNDLVSMAVRINAGCTLLTIITFEDRESASNKPDLQLQGTNAVSLTTFRASDSAPVSWPLYAGLAAVAALALIGAVALRRRSA